MRPSSAGAKKVSNAGRISFPSPSGSGRVSGSAHSFMMVSVPRFDPSRITVFLKSMVRPSLSSSWPLSNT